MRRGEVYDAVFDPGEPVRALAKTRLLLQRGVLSESALAELNRALLMALDLPNQS